MKTKMNRLLGMAVLSGMAGCMALLSSVAEANGGGYTRGSAYGDILPFEMDEVGQVAMLEEDLQIDLWTSYADVKVTYRMKNTQNRPVKVRFGFPIEAETGFEASEENRPQSSSPLIYRVTARGREISSRQMEQACGPILRSSGGVVESWMVSELEFAPSEELTLSIDCRVNHLVRGFFVESKGSERREMVYRLSSAAVWNGPIRKGKIVIRPHSVDADEVRVVTPANRFKRNGDAWIWSFENLEPTLADDIRIAVVPDEELLFSSMEDDVRNNVVHRGTIWMRQMGPQEFDIRASSESAPLPAMWGNDARISVRTPSRTVMPLTAVQGKDEPLVFAAENLSRSAMYVPARCIWGEGVPGPGIGESVTVALKKAERLAGFYVTPCYFDECESGGVAKVVRNSSEFNSVTEMEVVVNGSWKKTIVFEPGLQKGAWVSLLPFKGNVKTVQLIIRKTIPGKEHDITCLSNLRLYKLLAREPKLIPCR